MSKNYVYALLFSTLILSCQEPTVQANNNKIIQDSIQREQLIQAKALEEERKRPILPDEIVLEKALIFDKYTLEDNYTYNSKKRKFQWEKIKEQLALVETFQKQQNNYGVISNYKNKNGEAPAVVNNRRNSFKRLTDTLGVERYQSVPLYKIDDNTAPIIYGRDGSLVDIISRDSTDMIKVKGLTNFEGEWNIPKRYVKTISDSLVFQFIAVVDVTNQNICLLERKNNKWLIRSMNPATTGKHNPPYGMETPVGMFVIQEQKSKMFYLKDGTNTIQGYAPWASRFTNGAYIHGVPTSDPKSPIIEFSWTLGTTPRSHMCVRNASSHAKLVYTKAKPLSSLVIVID